MSGMIVVQINGEVFANDRGPKYPDQRRNAEQLANYLKPLLASDLKIVLTHGNKPEIGYVLMRSELASRFVHTIPLDVCGADTQATTGYLLSQAITKVLRPIGQMRAVTCMVTQAVVDITKLEDPTACQMVGPWFDRNKADQYRQTRGWKIIEESGMGCRRIVPSVPALEILEIEDIRRLVAAGTIVIAAGGGGIPVVRTPSGILEGVEAVVETETSTGLLAEQLKANIIVMILDSDEKFLLADLSTETYNYLSLEALDHLLADNMLADYTALPHASVRSKLIAASHFLHCGGEQVVISTLRTLPHALTHKSGLWLGSETASISLMGSQP